MLATLAFRRGHRSRCSFRVLPAEVSPCAFHIRECSEPAILRRKCLCLVFLFVNKSFCGCALEVRSYKSLCYLVCDSCSWDPGLPCTGNALCVSLSPTSARLFVRCQHLPHLLRTHQAGRLRVLRQAQEQRADHARRSEQHPGDSRWGLACCAFAEATHCGAPAAWVSWQLRGQRGPVGREGF